MHLIRASTSRAKATLIGALVPLVLESFEEDDTENLRGHVYQANVMCFVDFASMFDSVDRDSLWWIMAAEGMPPKLLRLIKAFYSSTKMKVRAGGSDTMSFKIRSSVRRG